MMSDFSNRLYQRQGGLPLLTSVLKLITLSLELLRVCGDHVEFVLDKLEQIVEPGSRHCLPSWSYWSCRWDQRTMLIDVRGHPCVATVGRR